MCHGRWARHTVFWFPNRATNFTQTPKKNKNEFWNCHLAMLGWVANPCQAIFTRFYKSMPRPLGVWVCEWIMGFKKWNRLRAIGYQPTEFKGSPTKRCWCPGLRKRALTFPNSSAFGWLGTHAPGTTIQSVVSRLHLQRETCTNGYGKTTSMIPLNDNDNKRCSDSDYNQSHALS